MALFEDFGPESSVPAPQLPLEGRPSLDASALDPNSDCFLAHYRLRETLGHGSFGRVKLAEHVGTRHRVAIKILDRKLLQQKDLDGKVRKEMNIMRMLVHPHIIRLYEVVETKERWYAVMEHAEAGELFDFMMEKGRLDEPVARRFFQQLMGGVEYCHNNKIVHRDLKPENILLDKDNNLKIADFGLSNHIRDGHFLKTSCGSPNYAAPEVICGKVYPGPEVDIWSCGVILYAMLANCLPFDNKVINELFRSIQTGTYKLPDHLSPGARDLIIRMLTVDPIRRITMPEIKQHPWYKQQVPRYLAMYCKPAALRLDEGVIQAVVDLGYELAYVTTSLNHRLNNDATVAYHLLMHDRNNALSNGRATQETKSSGCLPIGQVQEANMGYHPRVPATQDWGTGCAMRGSAAEAMSDIVKVLTAHGIDYNRPAAYTLKCRKAISRPGTPPRPLVPDGLKVGDAQRRKLAHNGGDHQRTANGAAEPIKSPFQRPLLMPGSNPELIFEVQLYRGSAGQVLVDLQRLAGDVFWFLSFSSTLLTSLKAI